MRLGLLNVLFHEMGVLEKIPREWLLWWSALCALWYPIEIIDFPLNCLHIYLPYWYQFYIFRCADVGYLFFWLPLGRVTIYSFPYQGLMELIIFKHVWNGPNLALELISVHQTHNGLDELQPNRSYLNHIPTWYAQYRPDICHKYHTVLV